MPDGTAESHGAAASPPPLLRVVPESRTAGGRMPADVAGSRETPEVELLAALHAAEERAQAIANRIEDVRADSSSFARPSPGAPREHVAPHAARARPCGVDRTARGPPRARGVGTAVDYPLRVTSDTPTFIALLSDMAQRPFAPQSPFLEGGAATQHATPYIQALAFSGAVRGRRHRLGRRARPLPRPRRDRRLRVRARVRLPLRPPPRGIDGGVGLDPRAARPLRPSRTSSGRPTSRSTARCTRASSRRRRDRTLLLTLLALERRSRRLARRGLCTRAPTMLVHPFTGVLLVRRRDRRSCRLAAQRDRAAMRTPIALVVGFLVGSLWPAYSLDRAFAETGLRGVVFIGLCVLAPLVRSRSRRSSSGGRLAGAVTALGGASQRPRRRSGSRSSGRP